ncbi:MAG: hypothetical protein DPW09_02975 [Anaerolineae bacterium]|nr:hypothetical protein [Anaerolineae bacterium]
MYRPQTGPLAPSAPRLLTDDRPDQAAMQPPQAQLRPWAALPRLRPVKVETLTTQLGNYERTITGLRLVEQHFPEALADYGDLAQTGWWELLAHLNNLVEEAGWWEVNWTALNEAWAWWMEESKENGDRLAIFLTYIPVRHYGLNQDTVLKFPPMELLYVLLDGSAGVASSDLLIAIELYDGIDQWDQADRDAAWARLHAIEADPGLYPEAVRWLPELARWACHRTGNPLLDRDFDPYHDGPWFRWAAEAEVEQTRSAWRRARPVIEQFRRLMEWYEADTSRLTVLANFLMEGMNHEQLDW